MTPLSHLRRFWPGGEASVFTAADSSVNLAATTARRRSPLSFSILLTFLTLYSIFSVILCFAYIADSFDYSSHTTL